MTVWTDVPKEQTVIHPAKVTWGDTLTVTVQDEKGKPLTGHHVLLFAWDKYTPEWVVNEPRAFAPKKTNPRGEVSFRLPLDERFPHGGVTVTVVHKNYKPYVRALEVSQPLVDVD